MIVQESRLSLIEYRISGLASARVTALWVTRAIPGCRRSKSLRMRPSQRNVIPARAARGGNSISTRAIGLAGCSSAGSSDTSTTPLGPVGGTVFVAASFPSGSKSRIVAAAWRLNRVSRSIRIGSTHCSFNVAGSAIGCRANRRLSAVHVTSRRVGARPGASRETAVSCESNETETGPSGSAARTTSDSTSSRSSDGRNSPDGMSIDSVSSFPERKRMILAGPFDRLPKAICLTRTGRGKSNTDSQGRSAGATGRVTTTTCPRGRRFACGASRAPPAPDPGPPKSRLGEPRSRSLLRGRVVGHSVAAPCCFETASIVRPVAW